MSMPLPLTARPSESPAAATPQPGRDDDGRKARAHDPHLEERREIPANHHDCGRERDAIDKHRASALRAFLPIGDYRAQEHPLQKSYDGGSRNTEVQVPFGDHRVTVATSDGRHRRINEINEPLSRRQRPVRMER